MASNDPEAGDAPETTEEEDKFFIDSGPKAGVKYPLKVIYCGGMYICNIHFKLVVYELKKFIICCLSIINVDFFFRMLDASRGEIRFRYLPKIIYLKYVKLSKSENKRTRNIPIYICTYTCIYIMVYDSSYRSSQGLGILPFISGSFKY